MAKIQKVGHEIYDKLKSRAEDENNKPEEKDETGKDWEDSKIHIKSKPQKDLNCAEHKEDCLIS
jgi:hypothetical protein